MRPPTNSLAQREALAYFGRDECYMERYLTKPRHVEVQVLCDTHGNAVYLGTRDCSAQRRHQKLIEEAPAAGIPDDIIEQMGQAAVAVAKGCDYTNAGTVEFLYEDGGFYYLEMNTRLQVEHPATELITGVDLVEQQLRAPPASRCRLPRTRSRSAVTPSRSASTRRILPVAFLPSPGPITALTPPDGFGTRWDTGYEAGDEISQFYDNLVGKLIVWGRRGRSPSTAPPSTRRAACRGRRHHIPADIAILEHDDFRNNEHSTKWVEEVLDLTDVSAPAPNELTTTSPRSSVSSMSKSTANASASPCGSLNPLGHLRQPAEAVPLDDAVAAGRAEAAPAAATSPCRCRAPS